MWWRTCLYKQWVRVSLSPRVCRRRPIAETLYNVIICEPITSRKDSTSSHFVGCFFARLRERLWMLSALFAVRRFENVSRRILFQYCIREKLLCRKIFVFCFTENFGCRKIFVFWFTGILCYRRIVVVFHNRVWNTGDNNAIVLFSCRISYRIYNVR